MLTDIEEREATAAHRAAMRELLSIPGVVEVGLGFKQTSGRLQPYWAYRVYVADKRPLAALPPSQRVPALIGGFPTDVLVGGARLRPDSGRPSLTPGATIARYLPGEPVNHGTAGLFVQRGTQRYLLTNQHILAAPGLDNPNFREVFSPERKACIGIQCNKPVAIIETHLDDLGEEATFSGVRKGIEINGEVHFVDCGLARLQTDASNQSSELGGALAGLRNLITEPRNGLRPVDLIRVRKRGAATGVTSGVIAQVKNMRLHEGTPIEVWELLVDADHGGAVYDQTVELPDDAQLEEIRTRFADTPVRAHIDTSGPRPRVRFTGHLFSRSRDSGSAVVDEARHVVGLHHGSLVREIRVVEPGGVGVREIPLGRSAACHIHSVFHALGLDPATALVLAPSPTAGAALPLEEIEEVAPGPCPEPRTLEDLERAFAEVALGRELLGLARDHLEEVAHLIHTRRRVKVAWHRCRGPAFLAAVIQAAHSPASALPREIEGVQVGELLRRMREVLIAEGSAPLARALTARGELMLELAERSRTLQDLLQAIRAA